MTARKPKQNAAQRAYVQQWRAERPGRTRGEWWCCPLCNRVVQQWEHYIPLQHYVDAHIVAAHPQTWDEYEALGRDDG